MIRLRHAGSFLSTAVFRFSFFRRRSLPGAQRAGEPAEGGFKALASDPQKRINFTYRATHLTVLYAKALIRT